ncbi:cell cycle progression protein 1 isoform X2 [Perognathus longimembris pacificus]|uniref:cell cycle progression protein 1 isoform X2 n=1 Tax=Perognathus longimembris pacificus TaxID=214514 RepID=UPI002018DB5A|nr:cell cycle progression protein 1 isoform X2 [Perognathus longimembris pacificus]
MSENSSDSDSSCGWTVINHEGSDVEMMNSVSGSDSCELIPECSSLEQEEVQVLQIEQGGSSQSQDGTLLLGETAFPVLEETTPAIEVEETKSSEHNVYFGTASDDSDIVTLEPPKLEEIESQEVLIVEEAHNSDDFNMGSSLSSQYAFCQPETVFSSQPNDDESSSDETSHQPSPTYRRRRGRKKTVSTSESEERLLAEQEHEPSKELSKRQFSSGLNKCVILALVIAISMGFGHFYGTIQIQKRQQLVRNIHEDELSDMKDYLFQCQQEQESLTDSKSSKENLASCWTLTEAEKISFETQKNNLATENQYLRLTLEKDEKAISLLQEELRKLREQIRILEDKGTNLELHSENQKLKQHLEEEKQKTHTFLSQRDTLSAEARMLRTELERERLAAVALRLELQQINTQPQDNSESPNSLDEKREIVLLQQRLTEMEQKLVFEQQRSDLWERLYVEAKDQNGKEETDGKKKGSRGSHRAKSKSKETLLGTVKETFDAMKNSTKEFVRHHKEKIKQAKEAVKENLKKFSDSVKSTFRHFKDTTKNIFDEKGNKRFGTTKETTAEKPRTVFSDYLYPQFRSNKPNQDCRGPTMQHDRRKEKPVPFEEYGRDANPPKGSAEHNCREKHHSSRKMCSNIFEGARQESKRSPFNIVTPVRIAEFRQIMERFLLKELRAFHHWKELDQFISKFFLNGLFRHDQKPFLDFVNDVQDYLSNMKEYQVDNDGVFEKLDEYIYRHFAHSFPPPLGPSRPDKKQRMVNIENSRHGKQEQKHLQPQPYKREDLKRLAASRI